MHSTRLNHGTSHKQQNVSVSYTHKIIKEKLFFRLSVRKTIWVKYLSRDALDKLKLCITCQSPALWDGSCAPWIFSLENLLLRAISEWMKRKSPLETQKSQKKRWETQYLNISQCVSFAIRLVWIWWCAIFTRLWRLSRFCEASKK